MNRRAFCGGLVGLPAGLLVGERATEQTRPVVDDGYKAGPITITHHWNVEPDARSQAQIAEAIARYFKVPVKPA